MGGLHSRNKGKQGERDVRDLFRKVLFEYMDDVTVIRRNHQQAEIGGADLVGLPYLSVEVKRVKRIVWGKGLMDWWVQCVIQADEDSRLNKETRHPCLVFRQDQGKWLVMFAAHPVALKHWTPSYPSIMMWEHFENWLKVTLADEAQEILL
jgi:hypothetical protein